jgi:Dihydrodipicolinate synthetase family
VAAVNATAAWTIDILLPGIAQEPPGLETDITVRGKMSYADWRRTIWKPMSMDEFSLSSFRNRNRSALAADRPSVSRSTRTVVSAGWATANPMRLAAARAACDPSIVWVGGLAEGWAPSFYAVGARGFTSGLINVWPERSLAIHAALEAGDYTGANDLIAGMKAFEDIRAEEMGGTNVTGVKAALLAFGTDCGPARPPSAWPLTSAQQSKLDAFLSANSLT